MFWVNPKQLSNQGFCLFHLAEMVGMNLVLDEVGLLLNYIVSNNRLCTVISNYTVIVLDRFRESRINLLLDTTALVTTQNESGKTFKVTFTSKLLHLNLELWIWCKT